MTIKINDSVLDELVCGDVSPHRYRQILNQLEAEPEKWRDCAIAFLQEQAIESELKSLSQSSVDWNAAHCPASESLQREEALVQLAERSQPDRLRSSAPLRDPATERLLRLGRWTSLAALLMVSFTIGWVGSGALEQPSQAGNTEVVPETASDLGVDGGFEFAGNVNPREQYMPIDRSMPDWLRELERRGLVRIESSDGIVPMQLENGSQVVIPTQMYRVVKNGQSY
jgi:hypothetical protein